MMDNILGRHAIRVTADSEEKKKAKGKKERRGNRAWYTLLVDENAEGDKQQSSRRAEHVAQQGTRTGRVDLQTCRSRITRSRMHRKEGAEIEGLGVRQNCILHAKNVIENWSRVFPVSTCQCSVMRYISQLAQ
jgi:hypothetical protein